MNRLLVVLLSLWFFFRDERHTHTNSRLTRVKSSPFFDEALRFCLATYIGGDGGVTSAVVSRVCVCVSE